MLTEPTPASTETASRSSVRSVRSLHSVRATVVLRSAAGLLVGLVFALFALQSLASWARVVAEDRELEVDYVSLVVAAQLARDGSAELYDLDTQLATQQAIDPDGQPRPFANPPHVVSLAVLLTTGGASPGYVALSLVNLAALGLLAAITWRLGAPLSTGLRLLVISGALASFSVATALQEGAITVLVGLGLALVLYGEHRNLPWATATGLLLASAKPHLMLVAFGVLVVQRRWQALGRACLLGVLAAAASLVVPGLAAWRAYPAALLGVGSADSEASVRAYRWWNAAAVLDRMVGGEPAHALSWLLFPAGIALVLVVAWRRGATTVPGQVQRLPLAVAMIVGLLVSPHTNPHDAIWVPVVYVLLRADGAWGARPAPARVLLSALALLWPPLTMLACINAAAGGSVLTVGAMGAFVAASCWLGPALLPSASPATR